jgi:hypothetical protein
MIATYGLDGESLSKRVSCKLGVAWDTAACNKKVYIGEMASGKE